VIVGAEAGNPTETAPLRCRQSLAGRLSVDVDVDPLVSLRENNIVSGHVYESSYLNLRSLPPTPPLPAMRHRSTARTQAHSPSSDYPDTG
jgi:hypothetical protein